MRRLRAIEEALLRGDSITTRELRAAHAHFCRPRELLGELGQHWQFAYAEANRLEMMCRQYLDARKERV